MMGLASDSVDADETKYYLYEFRSRVKWYYDFDLNVYIVNPLYENDFKAAMSRSFH